MGAGVSCAQEGTSEQGKTLETPQNFSLSEMEILSWDSVENATGYCVEINDEEYRTKETNLDVFKLLYQPGEYTISLYAYGKNGFLPSEYTSLSYSIPSLQGKLAFKSINNGKEVSITGVDVDNIEGKLVFPDMVGNIPVTGIEGNAFINAKKITGVLLPQNLETVGVSAFKGCTTLKRVEWGINIEEVPTSCFKGCPQLEQITFSEGLKKIGRESLEDCAKLERLSLPSTLQVIDLMGAPNLKHIEVHEANRVYKSVENKCILLRENNTLVVGTEEAFIPEETTSIGIKAFRGTGVTSVTIPQSVKSIGAYAFSDCAHLTEVIFEEGVEVLGSQVFEGSGSLQEINLPNTLTTIGAYAFKNCVSLQSLRIPKNVIESSTAFPA